MARKIRMGMIGGGRGAFIGIVHRMAAALDGQIELVSGAFSSDAERSKLSGQDLFLNPDRVYGTFEEMILKEAQLSPEEKIDLISIVTPNHLHFQPAKLALENGFHVICDKPLCFDLEEAYALKTIVEQSNQIFALTHIYTGYPMVKQARHMVRSGQLGEIKKIIVEYSQGWLATLLEASDHQQASWRTDPSRSGIAGAMGDIGTHAENLAEYMSGLQIKSVCADINTMVKGRKLDDDGNVLLKFENGASGLLVASQISVGEENYVKIKIFGEKAGLEWQQMEPNTLRVKYQDQPDMMYRTGVGDLCASAQAHTRLPGGHPEGFIEAFANIYRNVALCIQSRIENKKVDPVYNDFPTISDGVRGMEFIYKVIESGQSSAKWVDI